MDQPKSTFNDTIRIDYPPGESDYNPLCTMLDANNCLDASGGTDDKRIIAILSVSGQIAGIPPVTGTVSGLTWTISGIGPLRVGNVYTLVVTATVELAGGVTVQCSNFRTFIAVNDSYSCPSGHSPSVESAFASVIPRYFRMRLHEEVAGIASSVESLTLGGLLEPRSVYLAYDSGASTLATPVWRDINLPENVGRWTLRITQSCCGSDAELVQRILSPHEVLTPMTFRCDNWSFKRPNLFRLVHSTLGVAQATRLTVVVEPA